jgi:hypothetical protein
MKSTPIISTLKGRAVARPAIPKLITPADKICTNLLNINKKGSFRTCHTKTDYVRRNYCKFELNLFLGTPGSRIRNTKKNIHPLMYDYKKEINAKINKMFFPSSSVCFFWALYCPPRGS